MKFEEKVSLLRTGKHNGKESGEFLKDVIKMAQGEAFEYLVGKKSFCGAKIDLSMRPMIPRTETEFWVSTVLEQIKDKQRGKQIHALDLFAGSGCVGIAVLKNIPFANIVFVDIDKKSEKQINISLEKNKINKDRTMVAIEDGVKFIQDKNQKKFDLIFAVPPYVPPQLKEEVMKELHAEDPLYFFDKEDGLFYIKKVLEYAVKLLNNEGRLFMEFDITQRDKIDGIIKENSIKNYSFLKDPYGHDCVVVLKND